jgi:hypothetical protein
MGKTLKKVREVTRNLLLIALSLFLLLHPIFHEYYDLMHLECLSPIPTFENPHPEHMVAGKQDHFKDLKPAVSVSAFLSLMEASFFSPVWSRSFPNLFLKQQSSILRC